MFGMSFTHWLVFAVVVVLLFSKNPVSNVMKDLGKGMRELKRGLADAEEEEIATEDQKQLPVIVRKADETER